MAIDTMIFGRVRSELAGLVFAHLVKERRIIELQAARTDQHRVNDIEKAPFMAVYDNTAASEGFRRSIPSNCAFPEDYILWNIDKIEIIKDDREELTRLRQLRIETFYADVVAIAILRFCGDGRKTRRLKIRLVYYLAGPTWGQHLEICQRHIEELDMNKEEPDVVQAVLAAEAEIVIS